MSYDVLVRLADGLGVPRGRFGLAYDDTTAELVAELTHTDGPDGALADEADGKRLLARVAELAVGAATIDPATWASLGGSYPRPPYQVTAPDVDRWPS